MNKREFSKLARHERREALEQAARDINSALNLFGRETIDELMAAAMDEAEAQRWVDNALTPGPDFPPDFCEDARPACDAYLRLARYYRECN